MQKKKKTNQKEFRIEKAINGKGDKLNVKWKGCNNSFNSGIDKNDIVEMSEYSPERKSLGEKVKVELDLSNCATKTDFKNATGVDTSKFAKKADLANLKSNVDKSDIDKLKNVRINLSDLKSKVDKLDVDKLLPVSVDLSKLSDVVRNDIIKKDVYNAKIKNIEEKISDINNVATKASLNAKINEAKGEIPSIRNLAITSAVTAVENKIPSVSNSVKKKTDYNTKINEIETGDSDIANFVNKTDFDNKLKDVTSNKNELNELSIKVTAKSTKGITKDFINKFSILNGAKYFSLGILYYKII